MAHPTASEVALNLALWRLQEQVAFRASLDARLGQSFALGAAMIALLGSALLLADPELRETLSTGFAIATSLFIASMLSSAAAYLISRWRVAPSVANVMALISAQDDEFEEVLGKVSELITETIEDNEFSLQVKSQLTNLTILLTAATAISIGVSALLAL